jgi:hypothetical protein
VTRRFLGLLNAHHDELGRLSIDDPVAALTIETMANHDFFRRTPNPQTFIFHRKISQTDASLLAELSRNEVPTCLQILQTELFFCSTSERALHVVDDVATSPVPAGLAFTTFEAKGREITRTALSVSIGESSAPGLAAASANLWVAEAGPCTVVWDVTVEGAAASETVVARLEVLVDDKVVGTAPVSGAPARQELTVPFLTVRDQQFFSWRLWFDGGARLTVEGAELRLPRWYHRQLAKALDR